MFRQPASSFEIQPSKRVYTQLAQSSYPFFLFAEIELYSYDFENQNAR